MPHQSTVTSKKIDAKPHKISPRKLGKQSTSPSGKSIGEERFNMISEAAYYSALGRDFDGGDPVEDWLMAEAEIDGTPQDWEDPDNQSSCD